MPSARAPDPVCEWRVGVFCQNEAARIAACLTSVAAAIGDRHGRITLVLNGSTDDSERLARAAAPGLGVPVDIVRIARADKSNAINVFLRGPSDGATMIACVDGYCAIAPGSMAAMAARLAVGDALAVSGVAGNGRTEPGSTRATVEAGGVLKGQLYALRPDLVHRMVARGIRLPVGLYRGDGLLGSMCAHDLDALGEPWSNARIAGVPEAIFAIDALTLFRWRDLRRQFRRKVRQMRGLIENAAIKDVIYARGYAALPANADDMIRDFLAAHPPPHVGAADRPFMALALRAHRAAVRPTEGELAPIRLDDAFVQATPPDATM